MRLQSLIGLLALTAGAAASLLPGMGNHVGVQADDRTNPVKGDNPLEFCGPQDNYLLQLESVDLSPNPPEAGSTLSFTAKGTLKERITEGAYVALQVKYGVITLIKQTVDLCEQVKNVDLECPLDDGELTITKDVQLPSHVPPGLYTVLADAYTVDDVQIICLSAKIRFNGPGGGGAKFEF